MKLIQAQTFGLLEETKCVELSLLSNPLNELRTIPGGNFKLNSVEYFVCSWSIHYVLLSSIGILIAVVYFHSQISNCEQIPIADYLWGFRELNVPYILIPGVLKLLQCRMFRNVEECVYSCSCK